MNQDSPTFCGVPIGEMETDELRSALCWAGVTMERDRAIHAQRIKELLSVPLPSTIRRFGLVTVLVAFVLGMAVAVGVLAAAWAMAVHP